MHRCVTFQFKICAYSPRAECNISIARLLPTTSENPFGKTLYSKKIETNSPVKKSLSVGIKKVSVLVSEILMLEKVAILISKRFSLRNNSQAF